MRAQRICEARCATLAYHQRIEQQKSNSSGVVTGWVQINGLHLRHPSYLQLGKITLAETVAKEAEAVINAVLRDAVLKHFAK
jgi:hypothetical protein